MKRSTVRQRLLVLCLSVLSLAGVVTPASADPGTAGTCAAIDNYFNGYAGNTLAQTHYNVLGAGAYIRVQGSNNHCTAPDTINNFRMAWTMVQSHYNNNCGGPIGYAQAGYWHYGNLWTGLPSASTHFVEWDPDGYCNTYQWERMWGSSIGTTAPAAGDVGRYVVRYNNASSTTLEINNAVAVALNFDAIARWGNPWRPSFFGEVYGDRKNDAPGSIPAQVDVFETIGQNNQNLAFGLMPGSGYFTGRADWPSPGANQRWYCQTAFSSTSFNFWTGTATACY